MGDTAQVEETPQNPAMPPEVPPPTIEEIATPEILKSIVKGYSSDYEFVDFSAEKGSNVGDNYMSIMYAMKIEIKNKKTGDSESIDVMLKTMPRNAFRQQMINDCGAFIKDAKMYNDVFPEMITFQKEKGLKGDEVFQGWPLCYSTFHDGKTDYLAMQNLRPLGYGMANRREGLDEAYTTLVLKSLARFHAISFAMFGGDFDKIMEKYPFLEEKMFLPEEKVSEAHKMYMKTVFVNEGEAVRKLGHGDAADLLNQVYDEQYWGRMHDLVGAKVKNAVVTHGDCWTNNMLFTTDEISGHPKSLKFVDFQLSRCASRCIDLNYFLYTSPAHLLFDHKEEEFLRLYHEEFNSFVSKLGMNPEEFELTWDNFKEEFDTFRYYGVVMGLMLAPILCADSTDVPDMENIKEEDFTSDAAKDFFGGMTGDLANKKIVNIALNHLPRCKQFPKV